MIAPPKPSTHDELEALIREARARQLRRRLLGAAGVAIAAALGLGIYALLDSGRLNTVEGSSSRRAGAPACRSTQLSASAELNGAAFGTMEGGATLKNVGDSPCSLPIGRPRVRILWRGRTLPTRETADRIEAPLVRVLAPHAKATISLHWANWCGPPRRGTVAGIRPTFRLRFADGLRIDAPGRVSVPPLCLNGRGGSVLAVGPPVRLRL